MNDVELAEAINRQLDDLADQVSQILSNMDVSPFDEVPLGYSEVAKALIVVSHVLDLGGCLDTGSPE